MTALVIIDWVLFVLIALSVLYVLVFALSAAVARWCRSSKVETPLGYAEFQPPYFLIIIPAYKEDLVIRDTVEAALQLNYTAGGGAQMYGYSAPLGYQICVVADHMNPETISWLSSKPVSVVEATYADSTKGKALHAAVSSCYNPDVHTHVVVLDADNIVLPDFLQRLASYCLSSDVVALQAHRTAKNMSTPIAMLDAISEEINNSVFRLGHNTLGLSSALIGSGMCFRAEWFADAVQHLETAGEDKELEHTLLFEGHKIHYLNDLYVLDEKVSDSRNFGQQRRRWLAAQFFTFKQMLKDLPAAIRNGRIDYIDKTFQQMLIPRSLLIALCSLLSLVSTILACQMRRYNGEIKWWVMLAVLVVALLVAIPRYLYNRQMLRALLSLPLLTVRMVGSLLHVRGATHNYIHTEHSA